MRIGGLDIADRLQPRALGIGRVGRARAIQREFRRTGIEDLAVVETHALAKMKGPGEAVRRNVPAARQRGQHLAPGVEAHQALVQVAVQDLADGGRGIHGGIEHRRLELHPQHERRGSALRRQQCQRGQSRRHDGTPGAHDHAQVLPVSNDRADNAMTLAEAIMSSITTYSSG